MLDCLARIIKLQGFGGSRVAQYEILQREPTDEDDETERFLVRHRLTDKVFVMKSFSELDASAL